MRPTPPGQVADTESVRVANVVSAPLGETSTRVVPVPCVLPTSLKLLMSVSPRTSAPSLWVTTAMPYGFTSPFPGTVLAMSVAVENCERNARWWWKPW